MDMRNRGVAVPPGCVVAAGAWGKICATAQPYGVGLTGSEQGVIGFEVGLAGHPAPPGHFKGAQGKRQ